ncbi:Glycosyl hydrolases family 2, sugar binding domain [Mucilaginibacter gossypiicola]|uniref:Glycosyl hydrolases family 2, sugar binding domain n=1 Tax=Mucilaginibacter gossypiicola TaxID=551995 RepID=A0A1H8LPD1_9SPHI|nr:glycosyl hydrolase [Mucilaginibacter gossypiicola]SEO06980.1 Glycosyl hydrolases family 2, sugar binding domain [Mucilaginibacter gossypiicola]
MERRQFIKNTFLTSAGLIAVPYINWVLGDTLPDKDMEDLFIKPPANARPWVFYMWMNGNITKNGITLDLEAMKRMGIGGFINFNAAVGIPRGPVDYAHEDWTEAVVHTAAECSRLGIDMFMHNSPGYSGCGGPWISPEMSMQQLVWTETIATAGSQPLQLKLQRPYAKLHYYRDAMVIAYPSLPQEKYVMKDRLKNVWLNGTEIDIDVVTDGDPETKIRLEASQTLVFEFTEIYECSAISVYRKPEVPHDLFDGPRDHPPLLLLESSQDGVSYTTIGHIACCELRAMDTPSALSFDSVSAKFYRLTSPTPTWISEVQLHSGPRLGGWPGKTNHTHGSTGGNTPAITPDMIINPDQVVDISTYMDAQGDLKWQAPIGRWTILRIGHTTTGEENAAHPDAGKGLETDKFNKQALDTHFAKFLDPLLGKLKPHIGKGFKGFTVDSWEAGKQNWTINFPEEFKKLMGYEIVPWMPALTGRIVGSVDDTEGFLWDIRKAHANLLAENFYGYYQQCCHKRGIQFNAEPYGDGVFDSLQAGQYLDTPMAEFWTRYIYGSDVTSKQAASIAHVYGKTVAAAEAYTAMPANSKWVDYPYSLKAEGDYFFTLGINRLVFHTFVHQPYHSAKPGMTMGPFGCHFDRNNTWTDQAYGWIKYIQRCQYILQQGLFVADACYFKGDSPESGVPDTYQFMPEGYVADVIGADALNRFKIKDGRIVLPDGMMYRVCILAKLERLLPDTLNKLKKLVEEGMVLLVSKKPSKAYGRTADKVIQGSIKQLFGNINGAEFKVNKLGKGCVIWTENLLTVFSDLSITADFKYSAENPDAAIHYVHKKTAGGDYYFISNHRRRYEKVTCTFRVTGMQPELWDPETGEFFDLPLFSFTRDQTSIAIELAPAGSAFIIFKKKVVKQGYTSIIKDGKPYLDTQASPALSPENSSVVNDFSISVWVRPDSFAQEGKSMIFHPVSGEQLFGRGHAAIGLGAGQNGVRIYEKQKGKAKVVLFDDEPVQGWTHLMLVYKNGAPNLYINGKLSKANPSSGLTVHAFLRAPVEQDHLSSYFEGNHTALQLFPMVLTEQQVYRIYQQGLPEPERPIAINLKRLNGDRMEALVFNNGTYRIKGKSDVKEFSVRNAKSITLTGPWKLEFPGQAHLADGIELEKLISLRLHPDFDIRHFSGTVIYKKTIMLTSNDLQDSHRILIDLGRVEVVAELWVNGKLIKILWKEPFETDITDTLKKGSNQLQINVTTLWVNRLIGDEYFPEENTYSADNYIEKLPGWFINDQPKPGRRKTFATWKNFDKTSPLVEAGLLGPVKLITAIKKII